MAYRKFRNIEYPVPGVDTAINTLCPGAKWSLYNKTIVNWEDEAGRQPPTWDEIEQEIKREKIIYNYYRYEREREREYGELKEQLSLIYDDIKSGNLENGRWIKMIEEVKERYPKPEGEPPV